MTMARPGAHRQGAKRQGALVWALIALAGGYGRVLEHDERPWASATFSGVRSTVTLEFDGGKAVEGGERLIADLSDHEFVLAGWLVVDATIVHVLHVWAASTPRLMVEAELLLLREG